MRILFRILAVSAARCLMPPYGHVGDRENITKKMKCNIIRLFLHVTEILGKAGPFSGTQVSTK